MCKFVWVYGSSRSFCQYILHGFAGIVKLNRNCELQVVIHDFHTVFHMAKHIEHQGKSAFSIQYPHRPKAYFRGRFCRFRTVEQALDFFRETRKKSGFAHDGAENGQVRKCDEKSKITGSNIRDRRSVRRLPSSHRRSDRGLRSHRFDRRSSPHSRSWRRCRRREKPVAGKPRAHVFGRAR